jgi:hypothetical protein
MEGFARVKALKVLQTLAKLTWSADHLPSWWEMKVFEAKLCLVGGGFSAEIVVKAGEA